MTDKESETSPEQGIAGAYNIITIGNSAVGKTCLTGRYNGKIFVEAHITTVGLDMTTKTYVKNGKNYNIRFWDTTGQERFASLAKQYLRKAHGVLFVYSINDKQTYDSIKKWMDMLRSANSKEYIAMALVGNKCDLPQEMRKVTKEEGEQLATELGMKFFETSAKTGVGVNESYDYLIEEIIENNKKIIEQKNSRLGNQEKKKDKCC